VSLDPLRRIIVGKKNIMDVYKHSWIKHRQDINKKYGHIGVHKDAVRTIEEQYISRPQLFENRQVTQVFQRFTENHITDSIDISARHWINRRDCCRKTLVPDRSSGYHGRVS